MPSVSREVALASHQGRFVYLCARACVCPHKYRELYHFKLLRSYELWKHNCGNLSILAEFPLVRFCQRNNHPSGIYLMWYFCYHSKLVSVVK